MVTWISKMQLGLWYELGFNVLEWEKCTLYTLTHTHTHNFFFRANCEISCDILTRYTIILTPYLKIPTWTTNPESSPNPHSSIPASCNLHTLKCLLNSLSQDSKTSGERSCWAMMQRVGLLSRFWFSGDENEGGERRRQRSTQVCTKGGINASL